MNASNIIIDYAKSNEHICICSTVSICLILIFIFSPLNRFILTSIIGKLAILIVLGYTLFYNVNLTNNFSNNINTYLDGNNSTTIKMNITCSYIFSFFLVVLILSVIRNLFIN